MAGAHWEIILFHSHVVWVLW